MEKIEKITGSLFSKLWPNYNDILFDESVDIFSKRLKIAGFDLSWLQDKTALDAGCGGGRNSIALARLGCSKVVGLDIGDEGLEDAKKRASGLNNVSFLNTSLLDIPFPDEKFDITWCAGVLHHTINPEIIMDELLRVTKKGGFIYLLVYATGGLRWPLIQLLRNIVIEIGFESLDQAIIESNLLSNKRRTILDDLFVPIIDFYDWNRLKYMLEIRGLTNIKRFDKKSRLDHESNIKSYKKDLESFLEVFNLGIDNNYSEKSLLFTKGSLLIQSVIDTIDYFESSVVNGEIKEADAENILIGQGHHRVLAVVD